MSGNSGILSLLLLLSFGKYGLLSSVVGNIAADPSSLIPDMFGLFRGICTGSIVAGRHAGGSSIGPAILGGILLLCTVRLLLLFSRSSSTDSTCMLLLRRPLLRLFDRF